MQFSKPFENAYTYLANDIEAWNPASTYDTPAQSSSYIDESSEVLLNRNDAKCKQRLLLAYYILDQQHSTLFGRPKTTCLSSPGTSLPFVPSQIYWDAPISEQPPEVVDYSYIYEALEAVPIMSEPAQFPHDPFRSMVVMACMIDSCNNPAVLPCIADDDSDLARILYAVEQSPRMKLVYHTFMLCRHTPIRDLLACAGESWIMAEKMSNQAEYTAAQVLTREWAEGLSVPSFDMQGRSPIQRAVYHALAIIELHQSFARTDSLFQEWSIYLAAVVLWARAYVLDSSPRRPSVAVPSPTEPRMSTHELDQAVTALVQSSNAINISRREAKHALLWVKEKIMMVDVPHNCGLTNGALDVLGKLVTRGHEKDWF